MARGKNTSAKSGAGRRGGIRGVVLGSGDLLFAGDILLRRWRGARADEAGYLRLAKSLTLAVGVLGTAAGLVFISPAIRSLMDL